MKITSKAGNGNKIHIYIDGEYTLTLYDDYWYRLGYEENREISDDELASLKEEAGFRSAYEKGLQYLSMRSYSQRELYNKLKVKYGEACAQRAIDKMLYYGYLNDEAYALSYARHLFEVKKFDIRRISYELKQKGVTAENVDNAMKSLDNEPIQRIIDMIGSKYLKNLENEKDRKRLVNRFVRMGYSFHDIKAAFREFDTDI